MRCVIATLTAPNMNHLSAGLEEGEGRTENVAHVTKFWANGTQNIPHPVKGAFEQYFCVKVV